METTDGVTFNKYFCEPISMSIYLINKSLDLKLFIDLLGEIVVLDSCTFDSDVFN